MLAPPCLAVVVSPRSRLASPRPSLLPWMRASSDAGSGAPAVLWSASFDTGVIVNPADDDMGDRDAAPSAGATDDARAVIVRVVGAGLMQVATASDP